MRDADRGPACKDGSSRIARGSGLERAARGRVDGLAPGDRGLTSILTFTLALLVVSLLTTAVFVGVGGLVEDQHETSLRGGLDVVGHRLASDVQTADRLATPTGSGGTVVVTSALPTTAAGSQYSVAVTDLGGDRYELRLRSESPDVTVTVTVRSRTPIRKGTVQGGTLRIRYDASANELVIERA